MAELFRKFENRLIKSGRYNSILISETYQFIFIYFNFVQFDLRLRCNVDIFKLTASAQSIYREVYDHENLNHHYNLIR